MRTRATDLFGLDLPLFAFSHCRDVVAAVSKAGGLGVLGALAFSPEQLEIELTWLDEHVDGHPYGVDVVMPASYAGSGGELDPNRMEQQLADMIPQEHKDFIERVLDEHDVPPLNEDEERSGLLGWTHEGARPQVEISLAHPIRLLVNALGPPPKDVVDLADEHGVKVAALVGSLAHAERQVNQGVDMIVAQGYEAGGHTGDVAAMVLVPEVVDAVGDRVPVLAAGGIGSGRQMAAAMALGADGVWTGSIWLTTTESDTAPVVMDRLIAAGSRDTRPVPGADRQAGPAAADTVDGGVGASRLAGLPAYAAAVHGHRRGATPHRQVRGRRAAGHAGRSDRGADAVGATGTRRRPGLDERVRRRHPTARRPARRGVGDAGSARPRRPRHRGAVDAARGAAVTRRRRVPPPAGLRRPGARRVVLAGGRGLMPAPALQTWLDQVATLELPPMREQPIEQVRDSATAFSDAAAGPPAPVARVEDRELDTRAGPCWARVYTPTADGGPLPVVAYFHGGGFVFMGIETHDRICRRLANVTGALVVSVDYRLAPEHRFPAALDDCYAATEWLATHAADLGGDPTRLAVAGDSAGGDLAAAVTLRARVSGPPLAAQVLVYPVCDAARDTGSYRDFADGYLLTADTMDWFWECYLGPDGDPADPFASPLRAATLADLPPAMVITGEYDPLRDEGEAYAHRLDGFDVPVELHRFDGMLHGFLGMDGLVPDADAAMACIGAFVRTHLS